MKRLHCLPPKTLNKQDEVIGTTSLSRSSDDDDGAPHWITVDSASTSTISPLPFHLISLFHQVLFPEHCVLISETFIALAQELDYFCIK